MAWVWTAFHRLSSCRPVGMGVGRIPWDAVNDWVIAKEIEDAECFERMIEVMDSVVIEMHHQRTEDKK